MQKTSALLIRGLTWNAAFSGISAVSMLLAADWVAAQVGLPGAANVYAAGVILILFAIQLLNIVRSGRIRTVEIVAIIVGDLLWVAGSVVLGLMYFRSFTTIGVVLIDVAALAVLAFAIMQIRGLCEYRRTAAG